jgi:hypothetical protein
MQPTTFIWHDSNNKLIILEAAIATVATGIDIINSRICEHLFSFYAILKISRDYFHEWD